MNKMGFQIQQLTSAARTMVNTVNPYTLKWINPPYDSALTHAWRARRPDGILVLRHWFPDENLGSIQDKVRQLLVAAEPVRGCNPVLEVPVNEAHQRGDDLDNLTQATLTAVRMIAENGYKPVIGIFSEGNPDIKEDGGIIVSDDWPRFVPALRAARQAGGYLGLHEYTVPSVAFDHWHILRYRKVHDFLQANHADAVCPILITEAGLDGGVENLQNPDHGFRHYTDPQGFAAWMRRYRSEVAKDAYVHGVQIFLCGTGDPQWHSFDIGDEVDLRGLFTEAEAGPDLWHPGTTDVHPIVGAGQTLEQLAALNPNIREQLKTWRAERQAANQDPFDYQAFRQHEQDLHAPDPGPAEFSGFRD